MSTHPTEVGRSDAWRRRLIEQDQLAHEAEDRRSVADAVTELEDRLAVAEAVTGALREAVALRDRLLRDQGAPPADGGPAPVPPSLLRRGVRRARAVAHRLSAGAS